MALLLLLLSLPLASAESGTWYRWTDASGATNMASALADVPPEYRDQVRVHQLEGAREIAPVTSSPAPAADRPAPTTDQLDEAADPGALYALYVERAGAQLGPLLLTPAALMVLGFLLRWRGRRRAGQILCEIVISGALGATAIELAAGLYWLRGLGVAPPPQADWAALALPPYLLLTALGVELALFPNRWVDRNVRGAVGALITFALAYWLLIDGRHLFKTFDWIDPLAAMPIAGAIALLTGWVFRPGRRG